MRAAVIENGEVVNVVMVDSLDALPGKLLVPAESAGNVGDAYISDSFIPAVADDVEQPPKV